jgi:phosphoserine phosphatase RsbU/P
LAQQKETIERQNAVMTRELEMARMVQQAIIPQRAPEIPGLEIALKYEPAIQLGGDVLDIIRLPDGKVLLLVADVMGHGVQAALVMSMVKTALHAAVASSPQPAAVLGSVNKAIAQMSLDNFVTAACCVIDPTTGQAELSLAGHDAPLWFQAESGSITEPESGSLPVGIDENASFETTEILLKKGDVLVFSTDGIVEAFDPQGVQYGKERLVSQLIRHGRSSAHEICESVRSDVESHRKSRPLQDDLALLVAKLT